MNATLHSIFYSHNARSLRRCLVALIVSLFAIGCAPKEIQIFGQVTQIDGRPIGRAQVRSFPQTDIVTTNNKGEFRLARQLTQRGKSAPIKPGRYRIIVSKEGYEKLQFDVVVQQGKFWANKRVMRAEQASIEEVEPVDNEEEVSNGVGAGPMDGI